MYPVGGPTKDTLSFGERQVYNSLKDALDDSYYVIHSVPWNDTRVRRPVREGEVDFFLIHPVYGIILFEVKGGRSIDYDGARKQWTTTNGAGEVKDIKDPFLQVRDAVYHLLRKLQQRRATRPYMDEYYLNSAVWFPDITWKPGKIELPHIDENVVLDSSALRNPGAAITDLFGRVRQQPISPAALKALLRVLAPTESVKAKLRDAFNGEEGEFVRLKEVQYRTLAMMRHHPRVAVRGAAGTGKTILALERARQFAADGLDVLFVCSNMSLARWLQSMIAEEPEEIKSRIEMHHMEGLCLKVIKQAGLTLPEQQGDALHEELGGRLEQIDLSSAFQRSIRKLDSEGGLCQFDAILVDEGQDIDRPLWGPLYQLLRDRHGGKFIVCFDPAQREREEKDEWFPPIPNRVWALPLSVNCRNTRAIFRTAQQFYRGLELPVCEGPEGRDVEWIEPGKHHSQASNTAGAAETTTSDEHEVAVLEDVLDRLIDKEGIAPREIIIVTCRSQKKSALFGRFAVGKHRLSNRMDESNQEAVRIVTIRSVKGLESPVVIIVEVGGLAEMRAKNPNLYCRFMYIATSRAKHHLIVLEGKANTLPLQPALSTSLL
ncbi:MAG TPA: NERD domain-containing protein [Ktedonobacterales bacterium]|nr:NERD domain-containing protein [Ktedonobacterales bacterium]